MQPACLTKRNVRRTIYPRRLLSADGKIVTIRIFVCLVVLLALLAAVGVFLPQGDIASGQTIPLPKPVFAAIIAVLTLLIYGGLGFGGLVLSRKLGFAELWSPAVSASKRLVLPALIGVLLGVFFILVDAITSRFHALGPIPHPPFPTSIVASASAGIGEEIIFRLVFICFWVWLVSDIILKKRWRNRVFWIVAVASALTFTAAHLPSLMFLFGMKSIGDVPPAMMAELLLINGTLSIVAAQHLRTSGLLAAISVHFWADVVWHVIWGPLSA